MTPSAEGRLDLPAVGERRSLREQVAHALRVALISGEMQPGMVYSAPVLAAQFGVSATPVREAMLDLAKEGLVEAVRNKGFRVTELSHRDLDELTHLRRLIEVPTVAALADPARKDEFERLRPLAEEIVAAAERGDLPAFVDADMRFHLGLLELAHNAHLVAVVRDLRNRTRRLDVLSKKGALVDSAREHLAILDALCRGDATNAEALMNRHLDHSRPTGSPPRLNPPPFR